MSEKITKVFNVTARAVIAVFFTFLVGVLTMAALTGTTGLEIISEGCGVDTVVQRIRDKFESVIYYNDDILANFIWLAAFMAIALLIVKLSKKLDEKKFPLWLEIGLLCSWTVVWGFIWVHTSQLSPTEDSLTVLNASLDAVKDKYTTITDIRYFQYYRFQLGYVFFNEVLIRAAQVFGEVKTLLFLQDISVVMLSSSYAALLLSANRIFKDRRIIHVMAVLLAITMQPVLTCSFLYGLVPGLAFAIWAVYCEIVMIQSSTWKGKIISGVLAALFVSLSVMIKSNNLIVLVAMVIYAVIYMFSDKKQLVCVAAAIVSIIGCVALPNIVANSYENRAGKELGDSIPFVSWFALGMNEADNAPGWYNYGSTMSNFENSNFDADVAAERSVEEIKGRLKVFKKSPQYRNDFFYRKYVSMWNETSYESIWNNQVRAQYKEKTGLAKWVCGKGEARVKHFMDLLAQFVFVGTLASVVYCVKKKNTLGLFPALITIGGMLYHLLAEAKSQYAVPYYVWMTAFAAVGIVFMADKLLPIIQGKKAEPAVESAPAENESREEKKAPVKSVKSKRMKRKK